MFGATFYTVLVKACSSRHARFMRLQSANTPIDCHYEACRGLVQITEPLGGSDDITRLSPWRDTASDAPQYQYILLCGTVVLYFIVTKI
ncbi:hypothetical protein XELAEV_18010949mg [Xenopus laevis]|uniref:Uncharacterized protein n=1 Tax=Xenopus laevis TaxID=8355 RepID=A0A974I2A8_XENLA|nr:hypothetical protein XELAEV_18010949mg [Xenopus laevis]